MEIIVSHSSADFDALASMVSAKKLYPRAKLFFTGTPEQAVREFMNLYQDFIRVDQLRNVRQMDISRIIVVDCQIPARLGELRSIITDPRIDVHLYDHHPPTMESIKGDVTCIDKTGACVTILLERVLEKNIPLTPLEATLMLLGIYEETGSMLFSGTTPRDAIMVAEMLRRGGKLQVVSDFIFQFLNEEQRSLLNDLILSAYTLKIKGFNILITRGRREHFIDGLALVTHRINDLERMDAVFSLVVMNDRIYMVGRSIRPAINVAQILRFFNGGGHATAGSAVVRETDLPVVEERLKKVLKRSIQALIRAQDIMSSPVNFIELERDMTLNQAHDAMRRMGHFNMPVMQKGKLVGIVARKDVDKARSHNYGNAPLEVYMSKPVLTTSPDTSIYQLQNLMMEKGISCLPVLSGEKLVGIVTRQDVLEAIYKRDLERHKASERPRDLINKLSPRGREILKHCGRVGDQLRMSVYVVGGFVRDLLMGVENLDIDIVVEGDGTLFGEVLARELKGRVKIHEKFGTSIVILPDGIHVDVATSRTEYYTRPAALPEVTQSSIKQDLYRRDFTINAMAIQLNRRYYGQLLDFFACRKDLKNGVIRILHPMSFVDDPTRILRAVKFEQRYQFRMDNSTENLLRNALSNDLFSRVSPERLRNEFVEILEETRPLPAIKRMQKLRILQQVHPRLVLDDRMLEVLDELAGVLVQFNDLIKAEKVKRWIIYFNVLVMRLEPDEIMDIARRFRVPNDVISRASFDKERIHQIVNKLCARKLKNSELYSALSGLSLETQIFIICRTRIRIVRTRIAYFLNNLRMTEPIITGRELISWGLRPGPAFKQILDILMSAQLDGIFNSPEGAREFYESRLKSIK